MKRLASLTLATVLALAACGGGAGATAATVNDRVITVDDVNSLLTETEVSKATFAQMLSLLIEAAALEEGAAELGITVTQEEIEAEANRIFEQFAQEGETREEFVSSRGYTEKFLLYVAEQEVIWNKIADHFREEGRGVPTDAEIEEDMYLTKAALTEACVSHILVGELGSLSGDELEDAKEQALADAQDLLAELDGGADFAELAKEHSTDTGSGAQGGDLGCQPPSGWIAEFRDAVMEAPVGEVLDEPVLSQFGYHIILVRERTFPEDEEVVEAIIEDGVNQEVRNWLDERITASEVTVASRFGTWNADAFSVIPPTS